MKKSKEPKAIKRISFEYVKSNFFRVIHADGIHGGLSPSLDIHMGFYSERRPIPQEVAHFLTGEGTLGEEDVSARKERKGMIREVDADVILDLNVARSVVKWLQDKIDKADDILREKQAKVTALHGTNGKEAK